MRMIGLLFAEESIIIVIVVVVVVVIIMFVYLQLTSATNIMNENKTKLRCKWRNGSVENINVVDWNIMLYKSLYSIRT